jgi:Ca-activated chloride channel family protein
VIKWGEPIYLWFLLAVPLGIALLIFRGLNRRRALSRAIDPELVDRLTPSLSPGLATLKQLFLLGALTFLLLAAARPKWGEKLQMYQGKGIDVVLPSSTG